MFQLYLFDLDQTLVDTKDMKAVREAGKSQSGPNYENRVRSLLRSKNRTIISEQTIIRLKRRSGSSRIGVFTRSPRTYVEIILRELYPSTEWDVVIAYEDVDRYKPDGQGVHRAMRKVGLASKIYLSEVLLVGDSDVDIRSAYNAGCRAALFKQGWPHKYEPTHWRSLELLPDLILEDEESLLAVTKNPPDGLPYLEHLLNNEQDVQASPRFDAIGQFLPNGTRYCIYAAGRYFVSHSSLEHRRAWHELSQSIQQNKDSKVFPEAWIETIRCFIANQYKYLAGSPFNHEVVVMPIPARPGRTHRLGYLVAQLQRSYGDNATLNRLRLSFKSDVLEFDPGVQSQSKDRLSKQERLANIRNYLFVSDPDAVCGKHCLVIDDVSTSGATLMYAKKYLLEAGARSVECFAMARTVSDPLRQQ